MVLILQNIDFKWIVSRAKMCGWQWFILCCIQTPDLSITMFWLHLFWFWFDAYGGVFSILCPLNLKWHLNRNLCIMMCIVWPDSCQSTALLTCVIPQIHKLLEAQSQRAASSQPSDDPSHQSGEKRDDRSTTQTPTSPDHRKKNSVSIAIGTGNLQSSVTSGHPHTFTWSHSMHL